MARKNEKTSKRKSQKAKQARTPKAKADRQKRENLVRLKVLLEYSKRLSKSNVPCCACCGMNGHVDFLVIDHIVGREEMDSELELVKLGYSSKMKYTKLINWLIKNDYPKGFQILCHSCNFAKFNSKNNTCPMENKPH